VYLGKNICYFIFRKSSIVLELVRGTVNPDGSKSKNYFNIDDPKKISKESSWTWKSGTKGTIYKIPIKKNSDIDYLMFLIKQKYKNQNL
jgi:predicted transport protein